jgi:hypothetical protein
MSTVVVPLAIGTVGVILLVLAVLVIGAIGYGLLVRDNPRQVRVDAEKERVAEEAFMRDPIDFQADLRPPPEDQT